MAAGSAASGAASKRYTACTDGTQMEIGEEDDDFIERIVLKAAEKGAERVAEKGAESVAERVMARYESRIMSTVDEKFQQGADAQGS